MYTSRVSYSVRFSVKMLHTHRGPEHRVQRREKIIGPTSVKAEAASEKHSLWCSISNIRMLQSSTCATLWEASSIGCTNVRGWPSRSRGSSKLSAHFIHLFLLALPTSKASRLSNNSDNVNPPSDPQGCFPQQRISDPQSGCLLQRFLIGASQ